MFLSRLVVLIAIFSQLIFAQEKKITQQIDDLIAQKERLIELLKEERTAVINQAVTKGLDRDVPMKDSGIEWLGDIPHHWDLIRLKFLVNGRLKYGANESAEEENQDHPRFLDRYSFRIASEFATDKHDPSG